MDAGGNLRLFAKTQKRLILSSIITQQPYCCFTLIPFLANLEESALDDLTSQHQTLLFLIPILLASNCDLLG